MAARFEPNLKRTFEMAFCETNEPKDVFIAIVKSMKTEEICSYFERYGEIESIGFTIRFKDKNDANKVLHCRHHKIGSHILTAELPRPLPKINNYKLVPSPRKHILDLDDKCLKKIGSYLSERQLVRMSATCVRLKEVAGQVFAMKYKGHFEVDLRKLSIAKVKLILNLFGATIDTLTLTSEFYNRHLYNEKTEVPTAFKFSSHYCCQALRELHVNDDGHTVWSSFPVNYPKLERLYWDVRSKCASKYDRCECPNLSKFISPLPNLKELTCTGYMHLKLDTLMNIFEIWPNIEKFCYHSFYEDIEFTEEMMTSLCKLKSLKYLDVWCSGNDLVSFLNDLRKENIPLESLILDDIRGDVDEVINGLSKLNHRRIKTVKLDGFEVSINDLIHFAQSLPCLDELEISVDDKVYKNNGLKEMLRNATRLKNLRMDISSCEGEIGTADYQGLVNIVKQREDKRKLSIQIDGTIGISNIDAETIELNREWLEISTI